MVILLAPGDTSNSADAVISPIHGIRAALP
jgi:hypothetical protein